MDIDGIVIRSMRALRGPNLYAYMPVLLIELDVRDYEHCGSDEFPGFPERLVSWLPGLKRHECSPEHPGGFVERLYRGTYFGHIAEHVCLELQNLIGFPVHFGRTRGTGKPGIYRVVVEYKEEEPARAAFETAVRLVLAAMHGQPFALEEELEHLYRLAEEYGLGPSTGAIVEAARRRDVPVIRLRSTGGLAQLGWGIYQKRIWASETFVTSLIAVDICQDKPLTNDILSRVGVPVPEGTIASSADETWEMAQKVGLPVVVKPIDGNQGKGVSLNLDTEAEVREAYRICLAYGSQVLVERFIEGHDYRMLVIGMASCKRRLVATHLR